MIVLVQLAKVTGPPPLSNLKRRGPTIFQPAMQADRCASINVSPMYCIHKTQTIIIRSCAKQRLKPSRDEGAWHGDYCCTVRVEPHNKDSPTAC